MTTEIQEYSQTEAALAMLRERYAGAQFPVETPEGMKEAKAARSELRKYRTDLERVRKEIKGPALERCRLIDAEAKRITEELRALEDPIAEQIEAEERRQEEERQERIRQEQERVESIQRRIYDIRHAVEPIAWDTPSMEIAATIARVEEIAIDEDTFAEFIEQARDAKDATLARLRDLHAKAEAREADEARREAERQELERLRAEGERRERIRARIREMREIAALARDDRPDEIGKAIEEVEAVAIDKTFGEFIEEAESVKRDLLARLRERYDAAVEHEAEQRREEIRARIRSLRNLAHVRESAASGVILSLIDEVEETEIDETFGELQDEARGAKEVTLATLRKLHAAAAEREHEEARKRAELERRERRQEVRDRISIVRALPAQCVGLNAGEIARVLARAEAFTIPEIDDAELRAEAEAAKADSIAAIRSALAGRKRYEAEQAERERREREEAERRRQAEEAARLNRYPGDEEIVAAVMVAFSVTTEVAEKWLRQYARNAKRRAAA